MNDQTTEKSYFTMSAIKTANRAAGRHWFDAATLRFFDGRVGSTVYHGRFFISSEQFQGSRPCFATPRAWTIRACNDRGYIETVGEFQQYDSPQSAVAAVKRMEWVVLP